MNIISSKSTKEYINITISSLTSILLLAPAGLYANPTGEKVVKGSATFERNGKNLKVTNSPGARINWQDFSIARDERTHFQQRNQRSSVYNRVVGGKPSNIFGTLSSNGRVYLVNPQGVIFGRNSRVDAAGFVASTMDFIANGSGVYKFSKDSKQLGSQAGNIINKGKITSHFGGDVWLVGENVNNEGVIEVDKGRVVLAAGNEVTITDSAAPELSVTIEADKNKAVNIGCLLYTSPSPRD